MKAGGRFLALVKVMIVIEKHTDTQKTAQYNSMVIPSLTVFVTSFCIMAMELVAGRIVARSLGSSLYTWTSVIGVVLAGITIGNYTGGRMADRFQSKTTLACLFAISSMICVAIIIWNNLVGSWMWLWKLGWSIHIFTHVCLVFLLPSILLGAISPIVAKAALDKGLPRGKTVGNIYAWVAIGSIAGTFSAGYYLIGIIGSIAVIWIIAAILLLMAMFYCIRLQVVYVWAVVFLGMVIVGIGPWGWAEKAGAYLAIRKPVSENTIYEDETAYCYVAVKQLSSSPDRRAFMQDKLKHSEILMDDILDLQYFYSHIFAAITGKLSDDKDDLTVLVIGGGGYSYPRYVKKVWPNSQVDVAEIDPGVTEAAIRGFGLARDSSIRTFAMDGRNYINGLLEQETQGGPSMRYDFIYEDAIDNYSVPYHLTTREFNDKISRLLTDDGVYMLNLIDIFESGLFLGAIVNTLEKTFPYVYVVARGDLPRAARSTFVVIAAKQSLDIDELCIKYKKRQNLWHLSESDMQRLREKNNGLVLTDDYAPIESLVCPVVQADAISFLCVEYFDEAKELFQQGELDACLRKYREIIDIAPTMSVQAYNEMGMILFERRKWMEAAEAFESCLKYIAQEKLITNTGNIHYNLAEALNGGGNIKRAYEEFQRAIEEYRRELREDAATKLQEYLQSLQAKQSQKTDGP